MRDHETELDRRGARVAAIGLGDMRYARAFREDAGIAFPLLVDEARVAYRAAKLGSGGFLHLLRKAAFAARARARAAGHRQHRLGRHPFQLGGSVVIGPGDVDLLVHRNTSFGDAPPFTELLEALDRAGNRPAP